MPVSDPHEDYNKAHPKWKRMRDCTAGADAVKKAGVKYLPKPNPDDTSKENEGRYAAYVERANYVNFTGATKDGMLGLVFSRDVSAELDPSIEYLKDNADGGGITLDQFARKTVGELIEAGRFGILTEYPQAEPGMTQAEVDALGLKASLVRYPAESIINWRTESIGGNTVLTMVVLTEPKEIVSTDGFSVETVEYHRVLLLKDGVYAQNIYNENDELIYSLRGIDEAGDPIMDADIIVTGNDGNPLKVIPFSFGGAENNDAEIDKPPMLDIANVNIAHYRNSADYEESSFMVGQPTPYAAGLSQSWVKDVLGDSVMFGSRAFLQLPEGGNAGLIQAAPNQMPLEAMREKEAQLVKLGARIIKDSTGQETAKAARIRYAGENSKLGVIATNAEAAIKQACEYAMLFMGGTQEPEISVNRQFYEESIDPQMVIAQIQLLDRGVIAKRDLRGNLRDSGALDVDRTDDEIDEEAEQDAGDSMIGGFGFGE